MADKKKISYHNGGYLLGISIVLTVITILIAIIHTKKHGTGFAQVSRPSIKPGLHEVWLEPGKETETFYLVDEHNNAYNMTPWVTFQSTPFTIHWEGGPQNGGIDEPIAALDDPSPRRPNNVALGKATYFSFESPPGSPRVKLKYSLTPAGRAEHRVIIVKNHP